LASLEQLSPVSVLEALLLIKEKSKNPRLLKKQAKNKNKRRKNNKQNSKAAFNLVVNTPKLVDALFFCFLGKSNQEKKITIKKKHFQVRPFF
jgi:hypothetical protein